MRRLVISGVALLASSVLMAQSLPDLASADLTDLERFAVDGFAFGTPVLGPAVDTILAKFGLPEKIEIRNEDAVWDIDIEETPADWIYPGYVVTTLYFRDLGRRDDSTGEWFHGPHRDSGLVRQVRVTSSEIALAFGLRVGDPLSKFEELFGESQQVSGWHQRPETGYFVEGVEKFVGRNVVIGIEVDSNDTVVGIRWTRAAWH